MTRAPLFITFTGADDHTDVYGMKAIHERYPVEWGILFSRDRQGNENRYPSYNKAVAMMTSGLRMAAHLCGQYAQDIMRYAIDSEWSFPVNGAKRVQINSREPSVAAAQRFGQMFGRRCILQCRDPHEFPPEHDVDWLFDASGGRGVRPATWPNHPGRLVGYAGGITPENVLETIERINGLMGDTGPYWLDMESGVRDENDRFDLKKVRAVCELVHGARP